MDIKYVVEGATLECTLGSGTSSLRIPNSHGNTIQGRKRANVGDHIGGENILSFGSCRRDFPPPSCIMATNMKWINGQNGVNVDGEPALIDKSITFCSCGGVISIVNNGLD